MRVDDGEVYDLVDRKGPITHRRLMDRIHTYSSDAVSVALQNLVDEGEIGRREGSLEQDGTTRSMYFSKDGGER